MGCKVSERIGREYKKSLSSIACPFCLRTGCGKADENGWGVYYVRAIGDDFGAAWIAGSNKVLGAFSLLYGTLAWLARFIARNVRGLHR